MNAIAYDVNDIHRSRLITRTMSSLYRNCLYPFFTVDCKINILENYYLNYNSFRRTFLALKGTQGSGKRNTLYKGFLLLFEGKMQIINVIYI